MSETPTHRWSALAAVSLCGLVGLACASKRPGASASGGASGGGSGGDIGGGTGGGGTRDAGMPTDAPTAEACGAPDGPTANESTDPSACTDSSPCLLGLLCSGLNCDMPWLCFTHDDFLEHPCPDRMADYCGCDGVTFTALDTCPDKPFEHWGACEDGVNCDRDDLRCDLAEPACPDGMVASVVHGSFGPCVAIADCRCEYAWECPHADRYTCATAAHRCGPIPPPDAGNDGADQPDAAFRSSGVEPSKRIDALTDDEKKMLCDFNASFYGGYGVLFQCGMGFALLNRYADQASCVASWPTACQAIVRQYEQCNNDRTCAHPTPASCDPLIPCQLQN